MKNLFSAFFMLFVFNAFAQNEFVAVTFASTNFPQTPIVQIGADATKNTAGGLAADNVATTATLGTGFSISGGTLNGAFLPLTGGTLTGNLLFSADNTYNIGASGATRPANGYFGTKVFTPAIQITTGATNGYILQSDASGNGSWVNPTAVPTDGNGIISALPAGDVTINSFNQLHLGSGTLFSELHAQGIYFQDVSDNTADLQSDRMQIYDAVNDVKIEIFSNGIAHTEGDLSPFDISSTYEINVVSGDDIAINANSGSSDLNVTAANFQVSGDISGQNINANGGLDVIGVSTSRGSSVITVGSEVLYEAVSNGTHALTFSPPLALAADIGFIHVNSVGTPGQQLTTDGNNPATLTWTDPASATNLSLTGTSQTIELTNSAGTDVVFKGVDIGLTKVAGTKDTLYLTKIEHWGEVSISGGSTSVTAATPERPDNDTPGTPTASLSSEFTQSGSTVTYIGAAGQGEIKGTISFSPSATGDYLVSLYQEGVEVSVTEIRVTSTASEYTTVSVPTASVNIATNDTFELRIEPVSGSSTITIHKYNVYARKIY